jgi:PiT family inorganic phosphate transporter
MVYHGFIYIIAVCILGFFIAWADGANGLANIMSTTIGSKSISIRTAMIIATVFVCLGAFLGGAQITSTIREGIINTSLFTSTPKVLVFGMLAILAASSFWTFFCSLIGMPISITEATVGSIIGFGAIALGPHAVYWSKILYILVSWCIAPVIGALLAYWIFVVIRTLILAADDPYKNALKFSPIFFFLVGASLGIMIILRSLDHFHYTGISHFERFLIVCITGGCMAILGRALCYLYPLPENPRRYQRYEIVEKIFALLMVLTACAVTFLLGSNDISITVGPISVVADFVKNHGSAITAANHLGVPIWAIVLACAGVVLGLLISGRKVIETVGSRITALTPTRAFAATFSAVLIVIITTNIGIPVSVTQILVGAVFGVGLARGIGALNLNVVRHIILSWFVTVPASAILSVVLFDLLRFTFKF